MRKNSWLQQFLCIAVILAMLLSMAGCNFVQDTTAGATGSTASTAPTTESTAPTTEATDPTTEPTTEATDPTTTQPTEPTTPPDDGCDLVYTLTQEDVDRFYALLAECEAVSLAGEDLDAIDAVITALDESYAYLDAQCSIALILHYGHTKDEALEQQYLDCVDICTEANDAYLQMVKRLYLSDSPAKDTLFEGWTEEDFADLMAYDEQIVQLQQRNAEIGVEYRGATNDNVKIQLYIEFVQNNNTIAQFYGYDNYYTYAYAEIYDRDYSMEQLEQMRTYAKTYLVETYTQAINNFYDSYYKLNSNQQNLIIELLYDDYDTLRKDYVGAYLDAVPENMSDAMWDMILNNSYFTDAKDAEPGAFTTMIGDRSYCYFGPGYASSSTVVHEGGHYYASLYSDLNAIPLDLAEVHSQGNEWLFMQFMKGQLPSNPYKALVNYKLYENTSMILVCLMVDEFEQQVYSTDLTGFTAADFNAIMDNIALQYFPNGDVNSQLANMNSYWRMVVVDQPVYYISYAVSSIASISLYTVAAEDFDGAVEIYRVLCEEMDAEAGFLGNIQAAGLYTPFDEEFYIELRQIVCNP